MGDGVRGGGERLSRDGGGNSSGIPLGWSIVAAHSMYAIDVNTSVRSRAW